MVLLSVNTFSQRSDSDVEKDIQRYIVSFSDYEYEDVDKAKAFLDSAEALLPKTDNLELHGRFSLYKGWYFQDISEFDKSRKYFYKSLDYYTQANAYNDIADVYGNLGNAYLDIQDLNTSLDYQFKSLSINEKILFLSNDEEEIEKARKGQAYAWSNISNIYRSLGEYEKALEYEKKGLNYEINYGDSLGMAISYVNLGSIFRHMNELDSALYYNFKSLELFKKHDYSNGITHSNINLFNLYEQKGELKMEYLNRAYTSAKAAEDRFAQASALSAMIESDYHFSDDSLRMLIEEMDRLVEEYSMEESFILYRKKEALFYADKQQYKKAFDLIIDYITDYEAKLKEDKNIDFESTETKYKFQQKAFQDSLKFQNQLNQQKLEEEKRFQRQQLYIVISVGGLVVVGVFAIFLYRAFRVKQATNAQLNEKNQLIEHQKELVETKNKEITDSITYAQRLQSAILPSEENIASAFQASFVFFQPKDVVSGDFYWFEETQDKLFLAVADCTGHGVPGAMVSVVCSNALNRSLKEFNLVEPAEILAKTRELVIETFSKRGENVKDGMDIALCCFDKKKQKLSFSGANNPLWLIRSADKINQSEIKAENIYVEKGIALIELKGDKQPIGLYAEMTNFKQHTLQLQKDDQIYLFSDGYADQFGGDKGKKLKYKPFKQLLIKHSEKPMKIQSVELNQFFNHWKSDLEQIDDVCVVGVRI